MAEVLSWVKDYGHFFATNPVAMLSALLIGGGIGYWLAYTFFASQLKAKDERIAGFESDKKEYLAKIDDLKARVTDAQKRLGIEPLGQHRHAAMTMLELQQCARNTASGLRAILAEYARTTRLELLHDPIEGEPDSEQQAIHNHQQYSQRLNRASSELMEAYMNRFRADTIALYAELRKRGGTVTRMPGPFHVFDEFMLQSPVNGHGIDAVSQALESLAMTLPI